MVTFIGNNLTLKTTLKINFNQPKHNDIYCLKYYSNITSKLKEKITGRIKHYVPANKEWRDSVYSYNKNNLKTIPVNYNMLNKLIRNHFNINALKKIARSRRMRSKIIRSSTRKLFVSSPEVKHNNDKTIVTVYVFNREKQFYIRKLFFYNRRSALYNLWLKNNLQKKIRYSNLVHKRKVIFKISNRKKQIKRFIPYYGMNLKNETDFLKYRLSRAYKKFLYLDTFFMYLFIIHILSLFKIKIISHSYMYNQQNFIKNILKKKPNSILWIDPISNKLKMINKNNFSEDILKKIIHESKLNKAVKDKKLLNSILWQFIDNCLIATGYISIKSINYLYTIFVYKNYKKIIYRFFNKGAKLFYNFGKLQINNLKFTNLLHILKRFIIKIYNKNTELNIVNLKYLHLNSDIYTQAIALKLRKKKSLLKVLRRSLKLVKIPFEFYYSRKKSSLNDLLDLNIFKSLEINKIPNESLNKSINNDWLNKILERFFPNCVIHNVDIPINKKNIRYNSNKVISILNTVKFKWVTGLRLEAAGRLTRRNTASRSIFKFKYKGNLENKQYYMDLGVLKIMPSVMLRNITNVNTQYTLTKSKKRIGSFGIKSWISGY